MDDIRKIVVENIRRCVTEGRFNDKVEPGDPSLSKEQIHNMLQRIIDSRDTIWYSINNLIARTMARCVTAKFNRETEIEGLEKIKDIDGAAIVTSNHFSPLENSILRVMTRRNHKGRLWAISQDTNFAMKGWTGYVLKYTDLIPISHNQEYMKCEFETLLQNALNQGYYVLMYPEQEMWWNYRKPRPLKRGAYYYAAKMGVPIISCFVQITVKETGSLKHKLFILDPIYPDATKSIRDNSYEMMETDYAQKKAAYETAYGKELNYNFETWDIAGLA